MHRPRAIDRLAAAAAHVFYRIDSIGGVPGTGPLLLLPNHPNALLDPALVMATAGRPVRFLAKSTLFSGPFALLLRAADAIPVYRKQDGVAMDRNEATFSAVNAALMRGEAVCVFAEGVSHSSGRLEPLRTGAARMALAAAIEGVDVSLVAVGINLERKTAFRSRALVAYGAPFRVSREVTGDAEGARRLTSEIAARMRSLLVEADPRSDAELVARVDRLYTVARPHPDDPGSALARRKAIAEAIHRLRSEQPEWYDAALIQLRRYDDRLRRFGLADAALDWNVSAAAARGFLAREVPAGLLLAPLATAALLAFVVPYVLTALAGRLSRDMDVMASAKVIAGALIYGAWSGLLAIITARLWGTPAGLLVLAFLPLLAVGGLFAIERESAAWRTARSWLALRTARQSTKSRLMQQRAELAEVLEQIKRPERSESE
jgi:1-acyl-sn-glycerol-3-phosphate acyltransferase